MTLVVDASIALSWCFADEQTPQAMSTLDRVARSGAVAPQLWPLEVMNGLSVAARRGRISREERDRALDLLHALPIAMDGQTAAHAWTDTRRLAEAHGLTPYDASYLELALRLGAPLATADARLAAAARAEGAGE